jgi:hypothetical protein
MKNARGAFYGLALLAGSAFAFAMSTSVPVNAQGQGAGACLIMTEIRTTEVTDARTIIYRMWNGDVWRNDLAFPCYDLVTHSARRYAQKVPGPWLCPNSQMITAFSGQVCRLGRFTRVN